MWQETIASETCVWDNDVKPVKCIVKCPAKSLNRLISWCHLNPMIFRDILDWIFWISFVAEKVLRGGKYVLRGTWVDFYENLQFIEFKSDLFQYIDHNSIILRNSTQNNLFCQSLAHESSHLLSKLLKNRPILVGNHFEILFNIK